MNKLKHGIRVYHQFSDYHHRKTKLSTLPQIAEIEPTDNCNLNCRFCSREAIIQHRGLGFMPLERFKEIAEKYPGQLVSPVISMHGEPTLHPDLPEMIRLVKKAGARSVSITTNGTLLTQGKVKDLVCAGLDGMEVSFEGTDKTTYEHLRRGAKFDVVESNLLGISDLRKNGLCFDVGINIIDNQATHEKLPEFKRFWMSKGFRVDVCQLIDWAGTADQNEFQKLVRKETFQHPFSKWQVCPMPWFFIGIDYNGWVVPCCHWLTKPMGNIFEQSLEEIWNGPEYVQFREQMTLRDRHTIPYCAQCWDGSMRVDSPYFCEPNPLFPLDWKLMKNVKRFLNWSFRKYKPYREF